MNDCACIWVRDYDCPTLYHVTLPRARKRHKCDECLRPIEPGEEYEKVTGKWRGRLDTFKTCADCLSVRNAFFCDGYAHGDMWEALWEHISDMDGEVASSCLEPLTPRARIQVIEYIDEVWEDMDDPDN